MTTIRVLIAVVAFAGCAATDDTSAALGAAAKGDGCPVGQQPVFSGRGTELVCGDVPSWPPPSTGSRSTTAGCALADGTYHGAWTSGQESKARPAFAYLKELTISGDYLVEIDIGYTSSSSPPILTEYRFNLDWVDASLANAWAVGDTDTWEFSVWRDCSDGLMHATRTFNLPSPNQGGPQIESWTFTGTAGTGGA